MESGEYSTSAAGLDVVQTLGNTYRYNRHVFLTPPWPEIFVTDQERRHSLAEAIAEYVFNAHADFFFGSLSSIGMGAKSSSVKTPTILTKKLSNAVNSRFIKSSIRI
jgi:hypothetical protein